MTDTVYNHETHEQEQGEEEKCPRCSGYGHESGVSRKCVLCWGDGVMVVLRRRYARRLTDDPRHSVWVGFYYGHYN